MKMLQIIAVGIVKNRILFVVYEGNASFLPRGMFGFAKSR